MTNPASTYGPTESAAVYDSAHTSPSNLAPGLYISQPQGHARFVDETRELGVANLGGVITIGGIATRDPDVLRRLGVHLIELSDRLAHNQAHPYHPGLPAVPGCDDCVGR